MKKITIATRGSKLALWQANAVADALANAQEIETEIKIIKTSGDIEQNKPIHEIGGKEVFTREIDRALLDGEADIAVHSLKDVPGIIDERLIIAATLPRADARDSLIGAGSIAEIPASAKIGTSSPRRRSQLLGLRPDLEIVEIRGNVETRIEKQKHGEVDCTILAVAGLKRLGLDEYINPAEELLPAAGQGIIAVATANIELADILQSINHQPTYICASAERAAIAAFGGDCFSPIAVNAHINDDKLIVRGYYGELDGSNPINIEQVCKVSFEAAEKIGREIGLKLKEKSK